MPKQEKVFGPKHLSTNQFVPNCSVFQYVDPHVILLFMRASENAVFESEHSLLRSLAAFGSFKFGVGCVLIITTVRLLLLATRTSSGARGFRVYGFRVEGLGTIDVRQQILYVSILQL